MDIDFLRKVNLLPNKMFNIFKNIQRTTKLYKSTLHKLTGDICASVVSEISEQAVLTGSETKKQRLKAAANIPGALSRDPPVIFPYSGISMSCVVSFKILIHGHSVSLFLFLKEFRPSGVLHFLLHCKWCHPKSLFW